MSDGPELNDSQKALAKTLDGMLVVDAGPGTGKTTTITERYINLISRPDINTSDVLLLTFTRNAATEMETKIRSRLESKNDKNMIKASKSTRISTFDSFCLSIVLDSPDEIGNILGIDEKLTRGARIIENNTLNKVWFRMFFDDFLSRRGEDYGDIAVLCCEESDEVLDIIGRLISKGIFATKNGWIGMDSERILEGDSEKIREALTAPGTSFSIEKKNIGSIEPCPYIECIKDMPTSDFIRDIMDEDRSLLFRFVHDVFFEYVRKSISADRLTFGITTMLAFAALYGNAKVRERNSYRYVMIDEFQDTNACQMMISLMILKEPNLCVVGDWKQGIYGFRNATVENITEFDDRIMKFTGFLNYDAERIIFRPKEAIKLPLDVNYRSSEEIIDASFRCLYLSGSQNESASVDEDQVQMIHPHDKERFSNTHVRYFGDVDDDAKFAVRCVKDYLFNDDYGIASKEGPRKVRLGDIAILCRTTSTCTKVMDALTDAGIPAFFQGDVKIMNTREGKLVLAWLRYINNEKDRWGYVPIMIDMGYSLAECLAIKDHEIPYEISSQRRALYAKRRRITDLITSIFSFYNLQNDITQSIISVISSAHRGSLLTISDIVSMIETDIKKETTYDVERSIDNDAVTIMTMHKSKGLEFPVVIVPFINTKIMPNTNGDTSMFVFDDMLGLRCTKTIHDYGDPGQSCRVVKLSWRTFFLKSLVKKSYDEERRLMFVALSRAKQYLTLIASKPSTFMKGLSNDQYDPHDLADGDISDVELGRRIVERPDLSGYEKPQIKFGVHELMEFNLDDGKGGMDEKLDEIPPKGKGKDYGKKIHDCAQVMFNHHVPDEDYPELKEVEKILDRIFCAEKAESEIDCVLPVEGTPAILRGRIDLIGFFEDRIEIHDYKTDIDTKNQSEYEFQLSVYAHAAMGSHPGKPVRCFIDYVSQGTTVEFDPLPMDSIRERVERELDRRRNP